MTIQEEVIVMWIAGFSTLLYIALQVRDMARDLRALRKLGEQQRGPS